MSSRFTGEQSVACGVNVRLCPCWKVNITLYVPWGAAWGRNPETDLGHHPIGRWDKRLVLKGSLKFFLKFECLVFTCKTLAVCMWSSSLLLNHPHGVSLLPRAWQRMSFLSPMGQHLSYALHAGRWAWAKFIKHGCPTSKSNLGI